MRVRMGWVFLAAAAAFTPVTAEPATGLRVAGGGAVSTFVAETSEGVLIVVPDRQPDRLEGREGTQLLPFAGETARALYCPSAVLDPATLLPGPDCVSDLGSLVPGPGAFAGEGRLDGTVSLGPADATACPTSLEVSAAVRSPGGDPFDLTGSFLLKGGPEGCREVRNAVRLTYASAPGRRNLARSEWAIERELDRLGSIDAERWLVIDRLSRLDDTQWETLRWLLSLEPERLEQLDAFYVAGAGDPAPLVGMVLPNGTIFAPGDPGGEEFVTTGLPDVVNAIRDIVVNIRSRAADLQSKITYRLPEPPPGMLDLASGIPIDRIAQTIQEVNATIGDLLALLEELRANLDTWVGNDCDASSGCGRFKARLEGVFEQVGETWCKTQHLACLDNPDFLEPRPLRGFGEGELLRTLLIDKPPPALLFATQRVLDLNEGWDLAVQDLNDRFPPEITQLCRTCKPGCTCDSSGEGGGPEKASNVLGPRDLLICRIAYASDAGAFRAAKFAATRAKTYFDLAKAWSTDDKEFAGVLEIFGGGGGGTNVKNPLHGFNETMSILTDFTITRIDEVIARRSECADLDAAIEGELRGCEAPRSIFQDSLGTNRLNYMGGRVDHWIRQAEEDLVDRCRAECFLHQFEEGEGTLPRKDRFDLLCDAYGELILSPRSTGPCADPDPSRDCAPGPVPAADEIGSGRPVRSRRR